MPTRNHQSEPSGDIQESERFGSTSLATKAVEKTNEAATFVGKTAEQATEGVGAGMESLGETIREQKPEAGFLGAAGEAVANKLKRGGRYLEEQGLQGIGRDITNIIRRNPVPAILIGIGVGFLLSRLVRR